MSAPYRLTKRALDLVAALALLWVLSPVLLGVAVAIRLRLGAPILFLQARPGLNGRPFRMVKFRTMLDASRGGVVLPDSERLTPFGTFLRATSFDELPELINVVRGDMSLVGPRPLLTEYLPLYSPEQMRRHEVRPGITGLAQVSGRNELPWDERFKLDVWYVDNMSFSLDMKILALTVAKVFRREGITQGGHATMSKFDGSSS